MNRRIALKQLAVALGGTLSLPAWASNWNKENLPTNCWADAGEEAALAEIVETFIPATNTPGAKELGVHQFIFTLLNNCFEKDVQERFAKGIQGLNEASEIKFGKAFSQAEAAQRTQLLTDLNQEAKLGSGDDVNFFKLVKGLTIHGYMNSEYVLKNILKYELVPARFDGCFPVKK